MDRPDRVGRAQILQVYLPKITAGPDVSAETYSETTAQAIDRAVRDLVLEAFDRARRVLEQNRDVLERGARRLLETETLDEAELKEFMKQLR